MKKMTILSPVLFKCLQWSTEVPVTDDGLFVTTRSGKGGNQDQQTELDDVDVLLKRKAQQTFAELEREKEKDEEIIRSKPKLSYVDFRRIVEV